MTRSRIIKFILVLIILLLISPQIILRFVPRVPKDASGFHYCPNIMTPACYKEIPFLCETFPGPCQVPLDWK